MDKLARVTGGVALIAAPVALVASELMYGSQPDDPGQNLAALEGHEASWLAGNLLGLLSAGLFIPAIVALAALTGRGRGRRCAVAGAVLGCLGVAGYAAHTGTMVMIGQMAKQSADRDAMAGLLDALDGNVAFGVVLALFLVGLYLGLVLMVVGAWRAHRIRRWSMVAVVAAVVLASAPVVPGGEYIAEALVIVGLGGAGLEVLRGSEAEVSQHNAVATTGSLA